MIKNLFFVILNVYIFCFIDIWLLLNFVCIYKWLLIITSLYLIYIITLGLSSKQIFFYLIYIINLVLSGKQFFIFFVFRDLKEINCVLLKNFLFVFRRNQFCFQKKYFFCFLGLKRNQLYTAQQFFLFLEEINYILPDTNHQ